MPSASQDAPSGVAAGTRAARAASAAADADDPASGAPNGASATENGGRDGALTCTLASALCTFNANGYVEGNARPTMRAVDALFAEAEILHALHAEFCEQPGSSFHGKSEIEFVAAITTLSAPLKYLRDGSRCLLPARTLLFTLLRCHSSFRAAPAAHALFAESAFGPQAPGSWGLDPNAAAAHLVGLLEVRDPPEDAVAAAYVNAWVSAMHEPSRVAAQSPQSTLSAHTAAAVSRQEADARMDVLEDALVRLLSLAITPDCQDEAGLNAALGKSAGSNAHLGAIRAYLAARLVADPAVVKAAFRRHVGAGPAGTTGRPASAAHDVPGILDLPAEGKDHCLAKGIALVSACLERRSQGALTGTVTRPTLARMEASMRKVASCLCDLWAANSFDGERLGHDPCMILLQDLAKSINLPVDVALSADNSALALREAVNLLTRPGESSMTEGLFVAGALCGFVPEIHHLGYSPVSDNPAQAQCDNYSAWVRAFHASHDVHDAPSAFFLRVPGGGGGHFRLAVMHRETEAKITRVLFPPGTPVRHLRELIESAPPAGPGSHSLRFTPYKPDLELVAGRAAASAANKANGTIVLDDEGGQQAGDEDDLLFLPVHGKRPNKGRGKQGKAAASGAPGGQAPKGQTPSAPDGASKRPGGRRLGTIAIVLTECPAGSRRREDICALAQSTLAAMPRRGQQPEVTASVDTRGPDNKCFILLSVDLSHPRWSRPRGRAGFGHAFADLVSANEGWSAHLSPGAGRKARDRKTPEKTPEKAGSPPVTPAPVVAYYTPPGGWGAQGANPAGAAQATSLPAAAPPVVWCAPGTPPVPAAQGYSPPPAWAHAGMPSHQPAWAGQGTPPARVNLRQASPTELWNLFQGFVRAHDGPGAAPVAVPPALGPQPRQSWAAVAGGAGPWQAPGGQQAMGHFR